MTTKRGRLIRETLLRGVSVLVGLFLLTAVCSPAFSEENCAPSMAPGSICSCSLSALRPTQISVGRLYVNELAAEGLTALTIHARKKPTEIAIGPTGEMFILDGHHHAAAMSTINSGASSTCKISAKLQVLPDSAKTFWTQMADHSLANLQGPDGIVRAGEFPPSSLNHMADDPFRSVAAWLEQACHLKLTGDYAEFDLANFLRHDPNAVVPQTEGDKAKALHEAFVFVRDPKNSAALRKVASTGFASSECK